MIASVIVGAALAFAIVFSAAYLLRGDLRAWIEQPKHRFQSSLERYDRATVGRMQGDRSTRT